MAVYTSTLAAVSPLFPANITIPNHLNLLHNSIINLSASPVPSFSTSFRSSSFAISISNPVRVTAQKKYTYPDPCPEFAEMETVKFRDDIMKKLIKDKDEFGDEIDHVVNVCAEIFKEFLNKDYGGPGTLMIEPFTDMLVALKERKLPGAPFAARASLLWAQDHVDRDWDLWNRKLTD